jgi:acyl-CoA reductase-like NAD-dependent aldehyde dehydrogenase
VGARKLYLAGEWRDGAAPRPVTAPWDGRVLAEVAFADAALVDEALARGEEAQARMRALAPHARRALLQRLATLVEDRAEQLAATICDEAGKPLALARGEVARAAQTFAFAAEEAWRCADEGLELGAAPQGEGRYGVVRRFPVGLTSAITPFNFPLNLVAHKLAPAFAAGCPVVLKPAPKTPLTALLLAELCEQAGLPRGGLSVLPADPEAAGALVKDARPRLLSFTGSAKVGFALKAAAGKKRVLLELGGDAALLVHHDADLDDAATKAAAGAFAYAGQVCISVQRLLVHERVYEPFKARLLAATAAIARGDPRVEGVLCGPLVDEAAVQRVGAWIDEARAGGAKVLCGGEREGNVVTPCVLEDTPHSARLSREEAFGPVALLAPYASLDEAIARVNASRYGLQAGVFTDSTKALWRCYEELEVGAVIHNDAPSFRVDVMPYGGVKDSGLGREGLRYALEEHTERRLLALKP